MMIWIVIQFSVTFALSPEEFKAFYQSKSEKQQQHNLGSRFPMPHFVRPMDNKMSLINDQPNSFPPNQTPHTTKHPFFTHIDSFTSQQTQPLINKFPIQQNKPNFNQDINKLIQNEKSLVKILNAYTNLKNLTTTSMVSSPNDHRFKIPSEYIRNKFQFKDMFDSQPSEHPPIWRLYGFRKGRKGKNKVKTSMGPDNQTIFSTSIETGFEVDKGKGKDEIYSDYINSPDLLQEETHTSYKRPKRYSVDENTMRRIMFYEPKARICTTQKGFKGKCLTPSICSKTQGISEYSKECGFHVCCINVINECGMAVMYNNTIWRNPEGNESRDSCLLKVFKQSQSICQIKLDLEEFVLNQPTNGSCRNDVILVSGQNINSPIPRLCGNASGEHLFIDVDNATGPVELNIISIGEFERNWDIIISQIECTNPERPPRNCLQYYTNTSGSLGSFNRNSTQRQYFNNLNYAICLKKHAGYCSIQYEVSQDEIFNFTNIDGGMPTVASGNAGVGPIDCPDDYIVIGGNRLCGSRFNDGSEAAMTENTKIIDTTNGPFIIQVRTNENRVGEGFHLDYHLIPCS